jgi:serine/threonine protein kinase
METLPLEVSLEREVSPEMETLPLEVSLEREVPPEMDTAEVKAVGVLLREILQYDPGKRPTAADLLNHPWFEAIRESEREA